MKISGALKRLMKKIEHYKGHELAGVLVSRNTNPINYFRAIKILIRDGRISKETPSTNNSAPTTDRLS